MESSPANRLSGVSNTLASVRQKVLGEQPAHPEELSILSSLYTAHDLLQRTPSIRTNPKNIVRENSLMRKASRGHAYNARRLPIPRELRSNKLFKKNKKYRFMVFRMSRKPSQNGIYSLKLELYRKMDPLVRSALIRRDILPSHMLRFGYDVSQETLHLYYGVPEPLLSKKKPKTRPVRVVLSKKRARFVFPKFTRKSTRQQRKEAIKAHIRKVSADSVKLPSQFKNFIPIQRDSPLSAPRSAEDVNRIIDDQLSQYSVQLVTNLKVTSSPELARPKKKVLSNVFSQLIKINPELRSQVRCAEIDSSDAFHLRLPCIGFETVSNNGLNYGINRRAEPLRNHASQPRTRMEPYPRKEAHPRVEAPGPIVPTGKIVTQQVLSPTKEDTYDLPITYDFSGNRHQDLDSAVSANFPHRVIRQSVVMGSTDEFHPENRPDVHPSAEDYNETVRQQRQLQSAKYQKQASSSPEDSMNTPLEKYSDIELVPVGVALEFDKKNRRRLKKPIHSLSTLTPAELVAMEVEAKNTSGNRFWKRSVVSKKSSKRTSSQSGVGLGLHSGSSNDGSLENANKAGHIAKPSEEPSRPEPTKIEPDEPLSPLMDTEKVFLDIDSRASQAEFENRSKYTSTLKADPPSSHSSGLRVQVTNILAEEYKRYLDLYEQNRAMVVNPDYHILDKEEAELQAELDLYNAESIQAMIQAKLAEEHGMVRSNRSSVLSGDRLHRRRSLVDTEALGAPETTRTAHKNESAHFGLSNPSLSGSPDFERSKRILPSFMRFSSTPLPSPLPAMFLGLEGTYYSIPAFMDSPKAQPTHAVLHVTAGLPETVDDPETRSQPESIDDEQKELYEMWGQYMKRIVNQRISYQLRNSLLTDRRHERRPSGTMSVSSNHSYVTAQDDIDGLVQETLSRGQFLKNARANLQRLPLNQPANYLSGSERNQSRALSLLGLRKTGSFQEKRGYKHSGSERSFGSRRLDSVSVRSYIAGNEIRVSLGRGYSGGDLSHSSVNLSIRQTGQLSSKSSGSSLLLRSI